MRINLTFDLSKDQIKKLFRAITVGLDQQYRLTPVNNKSYIRELNEITKQVERNWDEVNNG